MLFFPSTRPLAATLLYVKIAFDLYSSLCSMAPSDRIDCILLILTELMLLLLFLLVFVCFLVLPTILFMLCILFGLFGVCVCVCARRDIDMHFVWIHFAALCSDILSVRGWFFCLVLVQTQFNSCRFTHISHIAEAQTSLVMITWKRIISYVCVCVSSPSEIVVFVILVGFFRFSLVLLFCSVAVLAGHFCALCAAQHTPSACIFACVSFTPEINLNV